MGRNLEEDCGPAGRRETTEEVVMRMYQAPGRCSEARISGELENDSPFSWGGGGEVKMRAEGASGREINLHTDKETGLPTRRSSGMERLSVHSWLLITASVTEKES